MSGVLIKHADYVVTVDAERRIIRDGAVAVTGTQIAAVGKTELVAPRFETPDCEVIDARGKLVLPGLIDPHIHEVQQLGRGLGHDEYKGITSLLKSKWAYEAAMDAADAYCAARLCHLELLRAGITCFADPGNHFPAEMARAVEQSGIRGIIARTALDVGQTGMGQPPGRFAETTDAALARSEEAVSRFHDTLGGRLRAWFSMRVPFACSDELLLKMTALAEKYRVGIIGHACESREEVAASHWKYGMSDVERLEKLGILGPRVLLLHLAWLHPNELVLVRKRDAKVCLGPGSSFVNALGSIAHGKGPEMLALGVPVGLGSDAAMACNFLDSIRQMYNVVMGYREAREDPKVITPETAVEMVTINGARATLWENEIGTLEVGKKADIAILDIMRPEWQPVHNPIANLVYSAHGGCTDTVLVDGRIVVRGGKVLTLDEEDLYREANDRALSLARRVGLDTVSASPWPIV